MLRLLLTLTLATQMPMANGATVAPVALQADDISRGSTGNPASSNLQEQFGGIVTNQTVSGPGQEFYKIFHTLWQDKPLNQRYAITVCERPLPRRGSHVLVEYQQRTIFEGALPSGRSNIQSFSERAVEIAYDNTVNAEVQRLLFREQDLGTDEF